MVLPSGATGAPASSTSRVCTPADVAGPAFAVGARADRDQRLGHAVPLDRRLPGERHQVVEHRHRQRGAAGHQQPGGAQAARRVRGGADAGPHRRYAEVQGAARRGVRLRGGPAGVHQPAAQPQRPEHAEDEPVHVVERKSVHQRVAGGPLPRRGQRVQVGGDRGAGQDHALGRAGGAAGVEHQSRPVRRRLGRHGAVPCGAGDRQDRQAGVAGCRRVVGQDRRGAGIAQLVPAFHRAGVRRHRHRRYPGEQRRGDRHDGLHAGHRVHRDHRQPDQVAGQCRRPLQQLVPRQGLLRRGHGRRPVVGLEQGGEQRHTAIIGSDKSRADDRKGA
jgi:hypothetical protein